MQQDSAGAAGSAATAGSEPAGACKLASLAQRLADQWQLRKKVRYSWTPSHLVPLRAFVKSSEIPYSPASLHVEAIRPFRRFLWAEDGSSPTIEVQHLLSCCKKQEQNRRSTRPTYNAARQHCSPIPRAAGGEGCCRSMAYQRMAFLRFPHRALAEITGSLGSVRGGRLKGLPLRQSVLGGLWDLATTYNWAYNQACSLSNWPHRS